MDSRTTGEVDVPQEGHRELVRAFPNGVLVLFDADLRYRIVGPDVLPFSKRRAGDMVGRTVDELFPAAAVETLAAELRATLAGEARSFDMTYDERVHHIETRPVSIDGAPHGVLVTQDVTTERETQTNLEEKTHRLETVASVLSHDLRNPLTVALGHLDLIEADEREVVESLPVIRQSLERISTIMSDAHALARDTTLGELRDTTLHVLAETAWQTVPTEAATLHVDDDLSFRADPGLVHSLFENLFRNAVTHGGPDVAVRVGALADHSGFSVEDDGPGVHDDQKAAVLEAGYTTGDGEEHSGLGLPIVAEIVAAHDWTLTVTDAAEGGARFEISGVTVIE